MSIKDEMQAARAEFRLLSLYQRFEHVVIALLTAQIAIVVVVAIWNRRRFRSFRLFGIPGRLWHDLQVIIALEFKKSLLVVADRRDSVVQIQAVVMIALLAVCRKILILDLAATDALHTWRWVLCTGSSATAAARGSRSRGTAAVTPPARPSRPRVPC
jgi:uncharacterized membrane protein (DUF373 family)